MMRLRQATMNDLNGIHRLAIDAGIGITTLPKDKSVLETRLKLSCNSFKKQVTEPQDEYYLFVLEDTTTGTIAGTSAIEANLGHALPFYSYKLSTRTRTSKSLKIRTDYQVLSLVNDLHGYSEICTLYLAEPYRKDYNGQLLSRSRFLYMAIHPERFSDKIIADMRGHSDEHGIAPFWEAIGKHFFKMSFEDADSLTLATDKQLIIDLMPRNPIYVSLLPQSAQEIIAKPHPHSLPALKILQHEGFRFHGYVDIFDAGPTVETYTKDIKTLHDSKTYTIQSTSDAVNGKNYLIANTDNFCTTLAPMIVCKQNKTCILSKETSNFLQLKLGDKVRATIFKDVNHA